VVAIAIAVLFSDNGNHLAISTFIDGTKTTSNKISQYFHTKRVKLTWPQPIKNRTTAITKAFVFWARNGVNTVPSTFKRAP
jgi:hypothetical protein